MTQTIYSEYPKLRNLHKRDPADNKVIDEFTDEIFSPEQLGITVTPRKVAMMMAGLKLARLAESPDHDDSWRDAIGYLALGSSFPEAQA